MLGYVIGRFWVEGLRIDNAHAGGGLRLNQWVALVVGVAAVLYLVIDWRRHRGDVETPIPVEPEPEVDEPDLRGSPD